MVIKPAKDEIMSPRPLFDETLKPRTGKRFERMELGTKWAGALLDITRKGIEINGYYRMSSDGPLYSLLRDSIFVPWDELEKVRKLVMKPVVKRKTKKKEEYQDFDLDLAYLESLPKVELNGVYYYIDMARRERRMVDKPNIVTNL